MSNKMTEINTPEQKLQSHPVILKAMKGYLEEGVSGSKTSSSKQNLQGEDLMDYVLKDPLVRSCFEITVGSMFKEGYTINNIPDAKFKRLKKARFDRSLRKMAWQLLMYQTSFAEIVVDGKGALRELPVYKSTEFEIIHDSHGRISGFIQFPKNSRTTSDAVLFNPKEIFYMSYNEIDSSLWGHATLLTLKSVVEYKHLVEDFIGWMFQSNQFRTVIKVPTDIDEGEIKSYIQLLIETMNDPKKFLLVKGETAEHKPLRDLSGFTELLNLLDYYRSQILSLLQLPPLQVGILSSSNRSNAEYQVRYTFYTRIRNLQRVLEDEINYELFPNIGLEGSELKFNLLDDKTHNDYLEMAQKMISMGANGKKVNEWLVMKGLDIPTDLIPEETMLTLDKNSSLHPSRQPSNKMYEGEAKSTVEQSDKMK